MTRGVSLPAGGVTCANVPGKQRPPAGGNQRGAGTTREQLTCSGNHERKRLTCSGPARAYPRHPNRSSCRRTYTDSPGHVTATHPLDDERWRFAMTHPEIDASALTHRRGKLYREILTGARYRGNLERVGLIIEREPGRVVLDGARLHELAAAGVTER